MEKASLSNRRFSYRSTIVDSIDALRTPVDGVEAEIVQTGNGRLTGRIVRATIGEVAFSRGSFSVPIRASGIFSRTRLTLGALLACDSTLKAWSRPAAPGDILVVPPGFDHHSVYLGPAAFAGLSIDSIELTLLYGEDGPLSDPDFWTRRHHCRPKDPRAASDIDQRLRAVFADLAEQEALGPASADYLKRCVIEAFTRHLSGAAKLNASTPIAPALKIVKEAENYVHRQAHRPVHISELCSYLKISRRTLHRCFADALGIGPCTFLRHKRLCFVHSALRRSDQEKTLVTDVATQFGFIELGRFSQQYRDLFGEYPHETLRR
jgi:AraC family ethanolamine operon transcriptional activator